MSCPVWLRDLLNEALELDPVAVNTLFNSLTYTNKKLCKHPQIPVLISEHNGEVVGGVLGALGLLNGTLGDGRTRVVALRDNKGSIIKFEVQQLTDLKMIELGLRIPGANNAKKNESSDSR